MTDKQIKELLEDIELIEIRQRAMKIQLRMLETHLESMKEKLNRIAEVKKPCRSKPV